jgi:type II secretory pathway component PulJ
MQSTLAKVRDVLAGASRQLTGSESDTELLEHIRARIEELEHEIPQAEDHLAIARAREVTGHIISQPRDIGWFGPDVEKPSAVLVERLRELNTEKATLEGERYRVANRLRESEGAAFRTSHEYHEALRSAWRALRERTEPFRPLYDMVTEAQRKALSPPAMPPGLADDCREFETWTAELQRLRILRSEDLE